MGTSILFVRALVEALEHSGVPRERFLRAAPIDPAGSTSWTRVWSSRSSTRSSSSPSR